MRERLVTELPDLVANACQPSSCHLVGPAWHGEIGLVLPVVIDDGPVVLKIPFPHPGNRGAALGLETFGGHGAVRIPTASDDGFTLLLGSGRR